MSKETRNRIIRYAVTVAVGALIAFMTYGARGGLPAGISAQERYRVLSDTFTVPALLLLLMAGLFWISDQGALDGIGFILSRTIGRLIPGRALVEKHETYGQYVERKHGEKKNRGYLCLVLVGAAFLVVGVVFTVLFYRAY